MKFYKRDPDRALAGMAELTLQLRGAYNTILDALYSRDGVLRDDDDVLRRLMGCHGNECRAVKAKLISCGKIWIEDGYIRAKGVEKTLKDAVNFSEKQRKSAEKRWETERKSAANIKKTQQNQPPDDAKRGNALIEIEKDRKKERPSVSPKKGSRFALTELPEDWRAFCAAERGDLDPDGTFARFADYWNAKPGKDGVKLDWLATWRNWVRNERRQYGNGTGRQPAGSDADTQRRRAGLAAAVERRLDSGIRRAGSG
jgi:uncharacterized protein YdaU (DUF1376 family)